MSKSLTWYWHRWRAMELAEMANHVARKWRQREDARRGWNFPPTALPDGQGFPHLPDPQAAPFGFAEELRKSAAAVAAGQWLAFGKLALQVDDPPHWHRDYLAGCEVPTPQLAFQLDPRSLPAGADSKLIWELSRWSPLVRLAQAAWLNRDEAAGRTCLRWLNDWHEQNPPWRGWNWTSALESGIRLVQLTWLDALLGGADRPWKEEWRRLRSVLLPPHVYFTWRYRSMGSSANNHLLGELAGVLMAVLRWPVLARWAAPLAKIQMRWEAETLAQFAPDGGNREQALNYHLFSFELCWQTRSALLAAQGTVSAAIEERLHRAAKFFVAVQEPSEPWDYGDSDDAFVTPLVRSEPTVVAEWVAWMRGSTGQVLDYWLGPAPFPAEEVVGEGWLHFNRTGQAVLRTDDWFLRWDVSPLGYLSTAAHGHLDALHLSLWYRGQAWVVDPGTGCYYVDAALRECLAGRSAHNGPNPEGVRWVTRLGPFLWGRPHAPPQWRRLSTQIAEAEVNVPGGTLRRSVEPYRSGAQQGWRVTDEFSRPAGRGGAFSVRWQFAPGTTLEAIRQGSYRLRRRGAVLSVVIEPGWASQEAVTAPVGEKGAGKVSPGFRQCLFAPCLELHAPATPGAVSTLFLVNR